MSELVDRGRLDQLLEAAQLDAVVSARAEHVRYLTGHRSFLIEQRHVLAVAVYAGSGSAALVAPVPEALRARDADLRDVTLVPYGDYVLFDHGGEAGELGRYYREAIPEPRPSLPAALAAGLAAAGCRPSALIGVDAFGIGVHAAEALHEALRTAGFEPRPSAAVLERARMVKTAAEIDRLDRAAGIAEAAIRTVTEQLAVGISERELAATFLADVRTRGADIGHWTATIGADRGWTVCDPSARTVQRGDVVRIDGGAIVDGYRSDVGATVLVEPASARAGALHEQLEAGFAAALAALEPGRLASTVFESAVGAVRRAGADWYARGDVGHGIGLDAYELPVLRPAGPPSPLLDGDEADVELETGMVLCVELPCPVVGLGGLQLERTFVVEPQGARRLGGLR